MWHACGKTDIYIYIYIQDFGWEKLKERDDFEYLILYGGMF